jgi:tRNA 2-thiouridine synthesizing protein C
MAKSLLLICRQPGGTAAREALDIALAGGAFELPIALLFMDDGVFQLPTGQQPAVLEQKDLSANLQALPLFGVDELYVCQESLARHGLADATLSLPATALQSEALPALLARFDLVMTL